MGRVIQLVTATALSLLWLTVPALAGSGSAIGFGIAGFGIGALVGSALAPTAVYVGPPYYDPYYDDPYYDDPYYYAPPPPMNWDGRRAYHSPAGTRPSHANDVTEVAPRRSTVKTPAYTGSVEQSSDGKLKAAQAKAKKLGGVQNLTSEDVAGLSREQLKKLRGY